MVDEVFLKSKEKEELKVRKMGQNGAFSYIFFKRYLEAEEDERNEVRKPISAQEYLTISEDNRDTER